MKRRKILVFIPLLGLFLSGCTFQEGFATAKSWIGTNIYHPVKDFFEGLIGKKDEEKKEEGEDTPQPQPGPTEATPVEITAVSAPASIEQGQTLATSSVSLTVKYSDDTSKTHNATKITLDTSAVADNVKGTAYYNDLSKEFTINVVAPTDYGTEEHPISVAAADAIMTAQCKSDGDLTEKELFVKGIIKSVDNTFDYETPCFELHVADEGDVNKVVYLYRVHTTEALKEAVVVGASIKFHGFAKNYKGTLEFVDNTAEFPCTAYEVVAPSGEDPVTGVLFDEDAYEVSEGGNIKVSATVTPLSAGNKNVTYTLEDVTPAGSVTISGDTITGVTAGGTATVKVTTQEGSFTDTATVTVTAAVENQMLTAYNAALALESGETAEYTVTGVVVGHRQSKEWFVQSEGVGIEYFATNNDFAVGKEVKIVSTFQKYNGLPETKTIKSAEVIKEEGNMPTPIEIASVADLTNANFNVLANVTGTVKEDASAYDATKDYSLMLETADGDLKVFIKKDTFSSKASEIQALKQGDVVTIGNAVTSIYNTERQILFCLNSTIDVATKEILEYGAVTGPAQIESGDNIELNEVNIAVTYTDESPGVVHPTSIDSFDNETIAEGVTVTVHHGEFSGTFTVNVIAAQEKHGTLANPYTVAEARAAIDAGEGVTDVYAAGIVTRITYAYSTTNKNMTFYMSDDGSQASELEAYKLSADADPGLEIGDNVVVRGNLKKHNSTYEFDEGCTLASIEKPTVQSVVISGTATQTEYSVGTAYNHAGLAATATLSNGAQIDVTTLASWVPSKENAEENDESVTWTATYKEQPSSGFAVSVTVSTDVPTYLEQTIEYTAGTTTNMDGSNQATLLGVDDTNMSVVGTKLSGSINVGLNKDNDIRLYQNESTSLTISVTGGTIHDIVVTCVSGGVGALKVNGTAQTASGLVYNVIVGSASAVLTQGSTGTMKIKTIVVHYLMN